MSVSIRISPENLLPWSNMEDFAENGTSAAPTEHTLTGTGATCARNSTNVQEGTYSVDVVRVGNDATLYYDLPNYAYYAGRKVTFGCWVRATVASRARIAISDGVGSTNSSFHTGGSSFEFLTVTRNIDASNTRLRFEMQVNTGNTTAQFDGGIACEGEVTHTILTDVVDVGEWEPQTSYRSQEFVVARRQGTRVPRVHIGKKNLIVSGMVTGTVSTTVRSTLDNITELFHSWRDNPVTGDKEYRDIYLFDDRYLRGHLNSFDVKNRAALKVVDYSAKFIIPDPFYRYINWTRSKISLSSASVTTTITPTGSAFSRPTIKVTAGGSDITSLTVQNLTSGQSFSYTGTIVAGNSLIIDTDLLTVQNNGADDTANFTGDMDMILLPMGNEVVIASSATGGTARIDWVDQWA